MRRRSYGEEIGSPALRTTEADLRLALIRAANVELAVFVPCPTCDAPLGERCRVVGARRFAADTHAPRIYGAHKIAARVRDRTLRYLLASKGKP